MNQVFICGTYFQVYVSILKTIFDKKSKKNILIINDHTPNLAKIVPALQANDFFDNILEVPFRKIESLIQTQNPFGRIFKRNSLYIQYTEQNSRIAEFNDLIKHSEINLFYNWGLSSAYFLLKYPTNYFRIIEDGTRNYNLRTSNFKIFKRKYILRTFIGDGFDDPVKEINVQHPEKLDTRIRKKGTLLVFTEMQKSLSSEDKRRILKVFMDDQQITFDLGHKKILLLTQPLSEDGFITESYKIQLYKAIVQQYSGNYTIYVKAHPRDKSDYKQLGYKVLEINRAFPLEMLNLIGSMEFDIGITIYSSSLINIDCVKEKIFLGKSYVSELLPGKKLF